jgi:hypothetical protein
MNLTNAIVPKSDQLNSDDLITGPRTIKIVGVEAGSAEQPVSIFYEGDTKRPYKPSKGMRRVLVALYGADSSAFVGKRLTLFNDTAVTFGPDTVGGIRISHASDIPAVVEIALTVKRGKRKPFRVEPLPPEKGAVQTPTISPAELQELVFAAENIGPERAKLGLKALGDWWNTLAPAVKQKLSTQKEEWKQTAETSGK